MKFRPIYQTIKLIIIQLACLSVAFATCANSQHVGWSYLPSILEQIKPPSFPTIEYDIVDFGAKGDGVTNCRFSIQAAIDTCHVKGGGRVIVPEGEFLTGAIELKSNVNLHIAPKSVLRFSRDYNDYLPVVYTRFEGVECMNYSPFIYAMNAENIAITGSGLLDGNAGNETWWYWCGSEEYGWNENLNCQGKDRDLLFQMAEDHIPVEERIFGDGHLLRPNFIEFYRCKNVLVDSLHIIRSPMWEIHPVLSQNITVQNIHIQSHGPNNDGCNPESSKNVLIKNCYFDTGDDCIAIKSGRNADGRRINVASENIVIQDCTMKDGHGGVVIGSEISGGCHHVFAENCIMDSPHLERVLRIKTNSLRGGIVEDIYMRNIEVSEVTDAVLRVNFNYERGDVGEFTPIVRNIFMDHVNSKKSNYAIYLDAYKRSPITGIYLSSCRFNGVLNGNFINYVQDLKLNDVQINGQIQ